jgi:hypothetical protein
MKTRLCILIVLMLASNVFAKTDIFGEERNASIYFGKDTIVGDVGFTPVERLDWGFRLMGTYQDDDVKEDHLKIEDWYVGAFVKYPFIDFGSVFPTIPIAGNAYAGVSLLYQIQSNSDLFLVPEIGVDVEVTENISGRVAWQYSQREKIFGDKSKLLAGFVVRW